ncbi:hypothetical protein SUGI_0233860 [Cryptomeria japonica]|nr:hypothetical protein SUGI_0233860 [Cryptomeria japonica]
MATLFEEFFLKGFRRLSRRRRQKTHRNGNGLKIENSSKSWVEEEVFQSWIVARACRPEYVIARSVLSSGAEGQIGVSVRVRVSRVDSRMLEMDHGSLLLSQAEQQNEILRRRGFLDKGHLPTEIWLGKLVLWCCWVLSEIAIGNKFVRESVLGRPDHDFFINYEAAKNKYEAAKNEYEEFRGNYRKVLKRVCMPEEKPGSLWLANRKSIEETKKSMQDGYEEAKKCTELIELISHYPSASTESLVNKFESLPLVKAYFPNLDKMCWKMTAVSYLKIIAKIFPAMTF